MAQISFYGQAHCGDCGATWVVEPMDEGDTFYSDHKCETGEEAQS